jgi:hypothetical protein
MNDLEDVFALHEDGRTKVLYAPRGGGPVALAPGGN